MIKIEMLSEKRWNHCRSVASFSYELAKHWGVDPIKAYLAGLFHDIAREMPVEQQLKLAKNHGLSISEAEKKDPILLHGAISAIVAQENYGINDGEILSAMEKHTLGHESMCTLDKIIFLADKIEPLRDYKEAATLRKLAMENLDKALLGAVESSIKYLQNHGLTPHPRTLAMKNNLYKEF
ncbi:MAG: bis(5'-nucleosyl)-tetraphosphatase (symmetrical) YqeK [Clostridiales bacterium]